jgi:hypothetical protein
MINLAINGKLRTCDLVKPRLEDIRCTTWAVSSL